MNVDTGSWDLRLVRGLASMGMSEENTVEMTDSLVTVLGALGCEAEFAQHFLYPAATVASPTKAQAEHWLQQLYYLCQRLLRLASDFEVAVQVYLHALVALEPSLADTATESDAPSSQDSWSARFDATPSVWWTECGDVSLGGEPIELWLRRAGFPYRHCIAVALPQHVDEVGTILNTLLHALQTLPPRGILTRQALYLGLQSLANDLTADMVPHHLLDIDASHVGLLTGIATVLQLGKQNAAESLAGDITWAHGELVGARAALQGQSTLQRGRITRPLATSTANLWASQLVREWEQTVAQLQSMQQPLVPTR